MSRHLRVFCGIAAISCLCASCSHPDPTATNSANDGVSSVTEQPTVAETTEPNDLHTRCKLLFSEVVRAAAQKHQERFMELTVDRHLGPPNTYWHHSLDTLREYIGKSEFTDFEKQFARLSKSSVEIEKQLDGMKFEEPIFKEDTHVLNLNDVPKDELQHFDEKRKEWETKLLKPAKLYLVANSFELDGKVQEGRLGFIIVDNKLYYVPW